MKETLIVTRQLPFPLDYTVSMTRQDFMPAPCNAEALDQIDRWSGGTPPALVLYGPEACGKTHLLTIWQTDKNAVAFDADDLVTDKIAAQLRQSPYAVVDDVDRIAGDNEKETALFHLYNLIKERNGGLLLASSKPVAQLDVGLADLDSRLKAAAAVGIGLPDDEVLTALLVKQFSDRQVRLSEDVVRYIIVRINRSFAAVHDLVDRLDKEALSAKKPVTIALVKKVMM